MNNVPSMIKSICILYFRNDEIFNLIKNDEIKLSNNKKIITKIKMDGYHDNANFGIIEIPSKLEAVYAWDINIIKGNHTSIGIASNHIENKDITHSEGSHYVFWKGYKLTRGNSWKLYGQSFKDGDKISVHLDLKQAKIKLIINGQDQGIAFGNVAKSSNITYRSFVSLCEINDCVEILDFTKNWDQNWII